MKMESFCMMTEFHWTASGVQIVSIWESDIGSGKTFPENGKCAREPKGHNKSSSVYANVIRKMAKVWF